MTMTTTTGASAGSTGSTTTATAVDVDVDVDDRDYDNENEHEHEHSSASASAILINNDLKDFTGSRCSSGCQSKSNSQSQSSSSHSRQIPNSKQTKKKIRIRHSSRAIIFINRMSRMSTSTIPSPLSSPSMRMRWAGLLMFSMTMTMIMIVAAAPTSAVLVDDTTTTATTTATTTTRGRTTTYDLSKDYDSVVVVAFGKASSAMATTFVQELFQIDDHEGGNDSDNDDASSSSSSPLSAVDDISLSGVVICKDGHATSEELQILNTYAPSIQILDAAHPVPDERSVEGARVLLDHVRSTADPRCLVVCCISGGGSALFCSPRPPLDLDDLQAVNRLLLSSGMSITEMNVVRKRLEDGKGGQLATACYPSTVVTLVLSDVLGDPLDLIASGPTVPDTSTAQDAWRIVQDYNLVGKLPSQVEEIIRQAVDDEEQQQQQAEAEEEQQSSTNRSTTTSTSTHPVFETSQTVLVGNNPRAVDAAATKAQSLGYQPVVLGTEMDGEAKEIAHFYVAMAKHLKQQMASTSDNNDNSGGLFNVAPTLPVALIAGGETTVTLHPDEHQNGKGGRNQEMALSSAILLESSDLTSVVFASAGTDGGDGPTDAAGAVVCADTIRGSRDEAMAALVGHDAYPYFDKLAMDSTESTTGSSRHIPPLGPPPLIRTGPTGTNVADVCVTLVR